MLNKVKEFVKEHKKEILIGTGVVVCSVAGVKISKQLAYQKQLPYKVICRTDNKEFAEGLTELINWNAGEPNEGAYLAWGFTAEQIVEKTSEFMNDSEDCLYSMVLEKWKTK